MLGEREGAVIAFDGDGTLWSGDVGEDLMHFACKQRLLKPEAEAALRREAARFGISLGAGDASDLVVALFQAYLDGRYPERDCCETLSWCYAGFTLDALERVAHDVLHRTELRARLTAELAPILKWARDSGVRTVVISASPRTVVEAAAAHWGFTPADVIAATPRASGGVVLPEMATPVPYAEMKSRAGRVEFGDAPWLASFGDNVFDIEMLQAAELGVAVRPKPKLLARLSELGLPVLSSM
jgi:phosphoserine phosphatase